MTDSPPSAPTGPGPSALALGMATVLLFSSSMPARLVDLALWASVIRHARCADSTLDADQWFPISAEADKSRQEAAAAIAVCATCQVRPQCLTLSLRHWDIGQHGVWGGLVAADRAALRRPSRATMVPTAPQAGA
jgi:hypothetical protein